jgi:hypothetical protein
MQAFFVKIPSSDGIMPSESESVQLINNIDSSASNINIFLRISSRFLERFFFFFYLSSISALRHFWVTPSPRASQNSVLLWGTPSEAFSLSSLFKRDSFIPPLEEEVDSLASAVEDGGVQSPRKKVTSFTIFWNSLPHAGGRVSFSYTEPTLKLVDFKFQ